jgi:hypothetical protein
MHKARCFTLTLVLVLTLPAGPALADAPVLNSEAGAPQMNTEAALAAFNLPTQDPCITWQANVHVLANFVPAQPAQLSYGFLTYNKCTNRPIANAVPLQTPQALSASQFVVEPNYSGASLVYTSEARNTFTGAIEPITLDLHWTSRPGVEDGFAPVSGTVSTDSLHLAFDNSLAWHRWGSDDPYTFPQAGLWKCIIPHPRLDIVTPTACMGQS